MNCCPGIREQDSSAPPQGNCLENEAARWRRKEAYAQCGPSIGRIHLTTLRIPNPSRPPRLCSFLRAHFQGAVITEVRAAEDDRVVTMIAERGPRHDRSERWLILELLGRDSNIILVDGSTGRIMDCLHHLPEKESGSRIVLPVSPTCRLLSTDAAWNP